MKKPYQAFFVDLGKLSYPGFLEFICTAGTAIMSCRGLILYNPG
jgi:hypothetical protein